jgi:hypothetical protein
MKSVTGRHSFLVADAFTRNPIPIAIQFEGVTGKGGEDGIHLGATVKIGAVAI